MGAFFAQALQSQQQPPNRINIRQTAPNGEVLGGPMTDLGRSLIQGQLQQGQLPSTGNPIFQGPLVSPLAQALARLQQQPPAITPTPIPATPPVLQAQPAPQLQPPPQNQRLAPEAPVQPLQSKRGYGAPMGK